MLTSSESKNLAVIQRRLNWAVTAILCSIIYSSTALASKETSHKPNLSPLKPASDSSAISISVQIDPSVDVDPTPGLLPNSFALQQNYPNPFNLSTLIFYSIPSATYVSLTVYNILGQRVATLVSEYKSPGLYSVSWDSKDNGGKLLASGVYFYRILTDSHAQTRKLLILR